MVILIWNSVSCCLPYKMPRVRAPITCTKCKMMFKNSSYYRHFPVCVGLMDVYETKLKCSFCPCLVLPENKQKHEKVCDYNPQKDLSGRVSCDVCNRSVANTYSLRRHNKWMHPDLASPPSTPSTSHTASSSPTPYSAKFHKKKLVDKMYR